MGVDLRSHVHFSLAGVLLVVICVILRTLRPFLSRPPRITVLLVGAVASRNKVFAVLADTGS